MNINNEKTQSEDQNIVDIIRKPSQIISRQQPHKKSMYSQKEVNEKIMISKYQGARLLRLIKQNLLLMKEKQNYQRMAKKVYPEVFSGYLNFAEGLKHTKSLERLIMSGCEIHPFLLIEISKSLTINTSIRYLDLSSCNLSPFQLSFLFKCLNKNTALLSLNLFNNQDLQSIAMHDFIDYLVNNPPNNLQLCEINISYCSIEQIFLAQFFFTLATNPLIHVVRAGLQTYSIMAIAALGSAINSYTGQRYLQELDIANIQLKDAGVKALDDVITKNNVNILKLNISGNQITEKGKKFLLSIIKKLKGQLHHLNIKYNKLDDLSDYKQSRNLRQLIAAGNGLTNFNPSFFLTHLDLSKNKIKFNGASILGSFLSKNPNLVVLDLSQNLLKSQGIKAIFYSLKQNTNLKSLNVSRNQADGESLICLMANNDQLNLEQLDFSGNQITYSLIFNYFSLIKQSSIKHLIFKDMVDDSQIFFNHNQNKLQFFIGNDMLRNLDISDNKNLSYPTIYSLFLHFNKIQVISLKNCLPFSNEGLELLGIYLEHSNYLQYLDVSGLRLGLLKQESFALFSLGIKRNMTLVNLDISHNMLSDYCSTFLPCLSGHITIQSIDLSKNIIQDRHKHLIQQLIKQCKSLQNINLSQNYICFDSITLQRKGYSKNKDTTKVSDLEDVQAFSNSSSSQSNEEIEKFCKINLKQFKIKMYVKKLIMKQLLLSSQDLQIIGKIFRKNKLLQVLDLSGITTFERTDIQQSISNQKMKKIIFESQIAEQTIIKRLVGKSFYTLEMLKLENCIFNYSEVNFFLRCLRRLRTIKEFTLSFCPTINTQIIYLLQSLKHLTSLQVLSLNYFSINNMFHIRLSQIIVALPNLTKLDLSHNNIVIDELLDFKLSLKITNSLKILIMNNIRICEKAFQQICEGLQTNKSITTLIINQNEFSSVCLAALNQIFKVNHSLTNIYFTEVAEGLTQQQLQSLILQDNIDQQMKIKFLDLQDNHLNSSHAKQFMENFGFNTCLLCLNIPNNNIGDIGAYYIQKLLESNSWMKELNISNNNIHAKGHRAIVDGLKLNAVIKCLQINQNFDGNALCEYLSELYIPSFLGKSKLEFIFLKENGIGEQGNKFLMDILQLSSSVFIYNDWNQIDNQLAFYVLKSYLYLQLNYKIIEERMPSFIKNLYISNSRIDDEFCLQFANNLLRFKYLENIYLQNNNKITGDGKKFIFLSLFDKRMEEFKFSEIYLINKKEKIIYNNKFNKILLNLINKLNRYPLAVQLCTKVLCSNWNKPERFKLNLTLIEKIESKRLYNVIKIQSWLIQFYNCIWLLLFYIFFYFEESVTLWWLFVIILWAIVIHFSDFMTAANLMIKQSKNSFPCNLLELQWIKKVNISCILICIYSLLERISISFDLIIVFYLYNNEEFQSFFYFLLIIICSMRLFIRQILLITSTLKLKHSLFSVDNQIYLINLWKFYYYNQLYCTENILIKSVPSTIISRHISDKGISNCFKFSFYLPTFICYCYLITEHSTHCLDKVHYHFICEHSLYQVLLIVGFIINIIIMINSFYNFFIYRQVKITQFDFDNIIFTRKYQENKNELIYGSDNNEFMSLRCLFSDSSNKPQLKRKSYRLDSIISNYQNFQESPPSPIKKEIKSTNLHLFLLFNFFFYIFLAVQSLSSNIDLSMQILSQQQLQSNIKDLDKTPQHKFTSKQVDQIIKIPDGIQVIDQADTDENVLTYSSNVFTKIKKYDSKTSLLEENNINL